MFANKPLYATNGDTRRERCAAEPVDTYVKRGGAIEDTEGRKCLCNGLFANIGHGQVRDDDVDERPIITSGDEIALLGTFFRKHGEYTAGDVIEHLLSLYGSSNGNGSSNGHVETNGHAVSLNGHHANGNGNGSANGNGVATPAQVHSKVIA